MVICSTHHICSSGTFDAMDAMTVVSSIAQDNEWQPSGGTFALLWNLNQMIFSGVNSETLKHQLACCLRISKVGCNVEHSGLDLES